MDFSYLKFRLFSENRLIQEHVDLRAGQLSGRSSESIQRPLFSIIIPLYGIDLVYLKECIESIENQTYPEWEICFCSDFDPVLSVTAYVESLARSFPKKIKLVSHKSNQGISKATLSALALATGDFIVFVDADDKIHKRALELCRIEFLSSANIDFIYTNHDFLTEWGLRIKPIAKPIVSPELLLNSNYINHLVVVRHDLLKKIPEPFAEYSNGCQDWDFCLKAMHFSRKIVHIPFFLYHWRTRKGSIAENPFAKPWAISAQIEVRSRYAALASSNLLFSKSKNRWELVERQTCYFLKRIESSKPLGEWIEYFMARLSKVSERFIHFIGESVTAEIDSLICYAVLPKVAFVWPFSTKGFRISFTTLNYENSELGPLDCYRSPFSMMTGNVLTGPFDHAVIEKVKLERIIEILKISGNRFADLRIISIDQLVAICGLLALENGLRNASVKDSIAEWEGKCVRVSKSIFPHYDPYL